MADLPAAFRSAWEDLRMDYAAGTNSRFRPRPTGVHATGSGADYHYRDEAKFWAMIERARYFDRNNMIVGQAVNRLVANILQDGMALDPDTGDGDLDLYLKQKFWAWGENADDCDHEGERTWRQMESLALRHLLVDGDVVALPLKTGAVQWVEAHRLRTPRVRQENTVHGVTMEPSGRRRTYWITKEELNPFRPLVNLKDTTAYAARDADGNRQVLHLYDPQRFSQRRGVTAFARVVDAIGMHDDIQFATLVKAQVAACFAILEELDAGSEEPPPVNVDAVTGVRTRESRSDGSEQTNQQLGPGMWYKSRVPGSKLKGFAPNIPNPEFFPHSMLILGIIACNLDLPVHVLLLDPSKTNFSGWRGAIDQARIRFRHFQWFLIEALHCPVYRWKLRNWIATDERIAQAYSELGDRLFNHKWNPPSWRYIEPLKDATASILRRRNNDTSFRRICAERGEDVDEVQQEIVEDNADFIARAHEKAVELSKRYGAPPPEFKVSWRDVAALPAPDGVKFNVGADAGGDGQGQDDEPPARKENNPPRNTDQQGRAA